MHSLNAPLLIKHQKSAHIALSSSLGSLILTVLLCMGLTGFVAAEESSAKKGEFLGAMDTVYPDWFKVSFMELEEDVAEAAAEGKRLMLLFHQDGCPYCNAFVEKNLAQKDIEDTLKTKFDVIEFNMWGDREVVSVEGKTYTEKEFAKALSVQFTPTVLFLTEEGQLALRLNGYYGPDRFRHVLDYVSNKMEGEQTFTDYLESRTEPASSKTLINREYYTGPITDLTNRSGKGDKPLLLLFEQGSCKNCETLHDKVMSQPESQELLSRFDVFQVDMWGRDSFETINGSKLTGREWAKELGVNYAPTLILFDADGTEVIRSEAFFKSFHVQSMMDYVTSGSWREQPSFQRYISARADEHREEGKTVNIWD
ncbi:MAG: thioredoxin fold domain-containing protein [Gammaproteobacteria bacterium]|nr:thioredoxin fold domain-containing protein [Gammaproteobacteria bacterium]